MHSWLDKQDNLFVTNCLQFVHTIASTSPRIQLRFDTSSTLSVDMICDQIYQFLFLFYIETALANTKTYAHVQYLFIFCSFSFVWRAVNKLSHFEGPDSKFNGFRTGSHFSSHASSARRNSQLRHLRVAPKESLLAGYVIMSYEKITVSALSRESKQ